MINISEITVEYISNTFLFEKQKVIYNSFSILESFGKQFYEDELIDLINRNDDIDSDTKMDMFINILYNSVKEIITEHEIKLNENLNIELSELNELASFLYIIQNLEDYDLVSYRLYAEDTPRNITIDLIEYLTLLSKPRIMELIEDVNSVFIESLKAFIEDKQKAQDSYDNIDSKHLNNLRKFFKFIDNTKCLGLTYFENNFTNITLKELVDLSSLDISSHIDNLMITNSPQAALDCLSVLLLCKDSYELPLLKFKQNTSIFTNKLENVTKLETILIHMLSDFNAYIEASKQQEGLNAN